MIARFLVVYGVIVALTIWFLVLSTMKKEKYLSKAARERFSMLRQKITIIVMRSILIIMVIVNLALFIIPWSIDIPCLISGDYATSKGIITSYEHDESNDGANPGSNFFDVQEITLNSNERFRVYYGRIVEKGDKVAVIYLPNSKFVLDIDIIK